MNRTLIRQLKRLGLNSTRLPGRDQWVDLLSVLDESYEQFEQDRYLLERALEISSREMEEKIRNLRQMSLQLAQANKLVSLGTLASGIAHELNNPLAVIKLSVELMSENKASLAMQKDLQKINKVVDRMASTIKHLLKLSRQGESSEVTIFDMREPLADSFELLRRQFEVDTIFVKFEMRASNYLVEGDSSQLVGVFQNLFTNARDAFHSSGINGERRITISIDDTQTSEGVRGLKIKFADTAGGMPLDVAGKIFDPFFTTKDVGQGCGLGLALSRHVIEEFHGNLSVQVDEGKGSDFIIQLPNARPEGPAVTSLASVKHISVAPLSQKPTMLVIDDEESICSCLHDALHEHFEVTTESSAQAAFELVQSCRFDVIVTDVKMPILSGMEIIKAAEKFQPSTKIVLISGHVKSELELDRQDRLFIEKPFSSLSELREKILVYVSDDLSLRAA